MHARSVAAACAAALVIVASAAADFTANPPQVVVQGAITSGTLVAAAVNAPTLGICVPGTNFQVAVSWTASTTPGVISYQVYQANATGGPWSPSAGSSTGPTSFTVTGLTNWNPASTYFYVRTIRGNWTSDSNVVSFTGPRKSNCK